MIDRDSPVTEDELHAYIDGELPADRKEAVASWLATHPEQAALVASWRAQAESVRARYGDDHRRTRTGTAQAGPVAQTGIAPTGAPGLRWPRPRPLRPLSSAVRPAGWRAEPPLRAPTEFETIAGEALDAYRLYVVEVRHPVEVPGSERAHMTQWLSKRLGEDLRIPDLQSIGLKLVGGRLLPGPTGAAAFYMYESASGERFTIYCAKVRRVANGAALHERRQVCRVLLGRRQDCLRREWSGRPRAVGERNQDRSTSRSTRAGQRNRKTSGKIIGKNNQHGRTSVRSCHSISPRGS